MDDLAIAYQGNYQIRKEKQQSWLSKISKPIVYTVRVFVKAGYSLIARPGTNAHLKTCC